MTGMILDATRTARAKELRARAEADLAAGAPDLLQRYPLQAYIDALDHHGRWHRFWDFTPTARAQFNEMSAQFAAPIVETYHRLLLAHLIAHAEKRPGDILPASVQPLVLESFDRILSAMERPRGGYYSIEVHLYRRDLAICRQKLIPCGSEVIDRNVRVGRNEVVRRGAVAVLRQMQAYRQDFFGPLWPVYECHWDRRLIRYFTPAEFTASYRRAADMLKANPKVLALISGQTWWYDPALRDLAPDMLFLREIPEAGGARFIRSDVENKVVTSDALAFSPERKALFEAGRYKPQVFSLVWRRRDLLAWAERIGDSGADPC